jgi:hypothetical protein
MNPCETWCTLREPHYGPCSRDVLRIRVSDSGGPELDVVIESHQISPSEVAAILHSLIHGILAAQANAN